MVSAGVPPESGRPLFSSRLIARTVISWSQSIWHDRRTPVRPLASRQDFSAAVLFVGSPSTNSTRQVVHRALPPHACKMSTLASCSMASTSLLPIGTSKVPYPSTVRLGMTTLYDMTGESRVVRLHPGQHVEVAGQAILVSRCHQPLVPRLVIPRGCWSNHSCLRDRHIRTEAAPCETSGGSRSTVLSRCSDHSL